MAGLGCLYVCIFGNHRTPILIAAHIANNGDFGDEPEDESYEND